MSKAPFPQRRDHSETTERPQIDKISQQSPIPPRKLSQWKRAGRSLRDPNINFQQISRRSTETSEWRGRPWRSLSAHWKTVERSVRICGRSMVSQRSRLCGKGIHVLHVTSWIWIKASGREAKKIFPNRFAFYSVKATCIKITGIKLSIFQLRLQVQVQFIMAKENCWLCEDSISQPFDPETSALPRRCDQWCIDGINRKDCMSWIFISCAIRTFQTLFERLHP